MKKTDPPIRVEVTLEASIEQVWKAITEASQMVQWYFKEIEAFEPTVGFSTRFVVENEGRIFPHVWKVTKVEPYKKIAYNWRYEGYTGDSEVTFELQAIENRTLLRLTHEVIACFSATIPEFTRESCLGGWRYFITERLQAYVQTGC
ncbi:SRPBCC family protein [Tenacibaculum sp. TC6]|uniref:SRPBCC family protein n=1 Tax=Tenacibaculum sp. TC6 TaxID=3423223 RepID=UPI003D361FF1